MRHIALLALCVLLLSSLTVSAIASDALVVHEWGTFTSFQDEQGRAIGGINTDDEPVPKFVHNIAEGLLLSRTEMPPVFFQGTPSCHPDVTMRLETPVLYFHADKNFHGRVDVRVEFKGGWLTQFYPNAISVAPNVGENSFGKIDGNTIGSLTWRNLELNASGTIPDTKWPVWTAPRAVDALQVKTEKGESEKYLFYRGVGHLDAPLKVHRTPENVLKVAAVDAQASSGIHTLWYADIRSDGTGAYRKISAGPDTAILATTPAEFKAEDYSSTAIQSLRGEMRIALIEAGLDRAEANALLDTWEISYFKSAGARVFFLVPPEWTERVMPLSVSGQTCKITRVMVGRIELVSPEQRAQLKIIAAGAASNALPEFHEAIDVSRANASNRDWNAMMHGTKTMAEAGYKPTKLWQAYLNIGRFRNALVLDEAQQSQNLALKQFIAAFDLQGYEPR